MLHADPQRIEKNLKTWQIPRSEMSYDPTSNKESHRAVHILPSPWFVDGIPIQLVYQPQEVQLRNDVTSRQNQLGEMHITEVILLLPNE